MKNSSTSAPGQGNVEYAFILILIALVVIAGLALMGASLTNNFGLVNTGLKTSSNNTSNMSTSAIIANFQAREQAYFNAHGSWPRTWSPYNFTDIGLNPADYSLPINGLYISPSGNTVAIANKIGDNIQVYVNDLNGNTLHLYDGWAIWCPISAATCYYHTVAPGNEVNLSTIYTTGP